MSLIPTNQSLFIVDLHYIASLDDISLHLDEHVTFMEQNYAAGHFIASGPKVPRSGGIILATAKTRASLENLLETDPFKMHDLAHYTVTEFLPSMLVEKLKS